MNSTTDPDTFGAHLALASSSTPIRATLPPLHKALIEYATISSRLLYIQDLSAWQAWTTDLAHFQELSEQEVCTKFLNDVLPNVYAYPLDESIKNRLKLLDLHPDFKRVALGYEYAPEQLAKRFLLQPQLDFSLAHDLRQEQPMKGSHTLLVNQDAVEHNICVGYNLPLPSQTAALFSMMVSSDLELSAGQLHSLAEIHSRLRQAKQSFEDAANLLPYRSNLDDLVHTSNTFVRIKAKLCQAMSNF